MSTPDINFIRNGTTFRNRIQKAFEGRLAEGDPLAKGQITGSNHGSKSRGHKITGSGLSFCISKISMLNSFIWQDH